MTNLNAAQGRVAFSLIPRRAGVKKTKKSRLYADDGAADVLAAIEDIKREMAVHQEHFDAATDECLIDSCIYAILSAQMRYQYFLKLCKERSIAAVY